MQYRLRPDMGFFPHVDLAELRAANLTPTTIQSLRSSGCAITPTTPASTRGPSWPAVRRPAAPWRGTSRGCRAAGCARNPPASRLSVAGAPFEVTADAGEPLAAASSGDRPVIAFHGTADGIVGFELADGPCAAPGPPRSGGAVTWSPTRGRPPRHRPPVHRGGRVDPARLSRSAATRKPATGAARAAPAAARTGTGAPRPYLWSPNRPIPVDRPRSRRPMVATPWCRRPRPTPTRSV